MMREIARLGEVTSAEYVRLIGRLRETCLMAYIAVAERQPAFYAGCPCVRE